MLAYAPALDSFVLFLDNIKVGPKNNGGAGEQVPPYTMAEQQSNRQKGEQ